MPVFASQDYLTMPDEPSFSAWALPGVPLVRPGDDLPTLIRDALKRADLTLQSGDVLVIASKIISKSEGCFVALDSVEPSARARELAAEVRKDPRLVELILRESRMVSRSAPGVLVTEHRLGFVSANAGIDQSNVDDTGQNVLLLPQNPDASAARIRQTLQADSDLDIAVVITDTHGRPFRLGNTGVAIGLAGMQPLIDQRGELDLFGREMLATVTAYADMIANAAHLIGGEGAEGRPLVLIRGLDYPCGAGTASELNRPADRDLYR